MIEKSSHPSHHFSVSYSYEEIRVAAFDVLSGRFKSNYGATQYNNFKISVAETLLDRDGASPQPGSFGSSPSLDYQEKEIFLELFWDLFRQGIITLGSDDANPNFPFCRLTSLGKQIVAAEDGHLVSDPQGYEQRLRAEVPEVDGATVVYMKGALTSFRTGCLLSATTMLGVAAEHTANLLLAKIETSDTHRAKFAHLKKIRGLDAKLQKFRDIVSQHPEILPADVQEGLDVNFTGLQTIIGNFKSNAGAPTGIMISRDTAFILLRAFPQYCKKAYQLMDCF